MNGAVLIKPLEEKGRDTKLTTIKRVKQKDLSTETKEERMGGRKKVKCKGEQRRQTNRNRERISARAFRK